MIKVEVRYFASLRLQGIKKEIIELPNRVMTSELLKKISIKDEDVAILLVNGIITTSNTLIQDKDIISLFPPVGGG